MTIEEYEEIESTHKYLKENQQKHKEKTVIIANKQTGGIGTKGRSWFTGSSKNIAMSILYKPMCNIKDLDGLTVEIAKKLQKEIQDLYNIKLKIKEPNDLMLNNKKICGILTETNIIGNKINYLIIINITIVLSTKLIIFSIFFTFFTYMYFIASISTLY